MKIKAATADTLIFFQPGYFVRRLAVVKMREAETVLMDRKEITLAEISVTDQDTDTLQSENNVSFLAFEFYDDLILCLTNAGKKYNNLLLLTPDGRKGWPAGI